MKRSGGVTVASVSMIVASAACCLSALWPLGSAAAMHREGFGILITFSMFQLAFAAWGISTGIALLRLRHWAWVCVLTISGLLILANIPGLFGARKLIRATTGVPTVSSGHFISHQYFHLVGLTLIPFVLGVWWLILFTRRGARLQFAAAAPALSEEGNFGPARSDAVTIAAILLFVGCAFLLLFAVITPLTALSVPQSASLLPLRGMLIVLGFFYVLIAAWGVVTGVGVLKRRPWGRISIMVIGAMGAAFSLLGSAGAMMGTMIAPPNPGLPKAAVYAGAAFAIVVMLIFLGISIWWLILFTRPRIALEFASLSAAPGFANSAASPQKVVEPQLEPAPFAAAPHFTAPAMPLSIRVISVLAILFGVLTLFAPLNAKFLGMAPPILVFGFLVHGWGATAFYLVSGIAQILFAAAVLWRKPWGLDALIVFLLAEIANLALIFVSPARARFNAEVQTQMQSFTAQMKMPDGSAPSPSPFFAHMNLFYDVTFAASIVLYAVLLFFLFTRREAFRAACSVHVTSAPAGGQGASV